MINITYKPKEFTVELNGHAGHGKKGKDIVCSAISCLFYTLAENLYECVGMLDEAPMVLDEEGSGHISCYPKKEYEANIKLIFWCITNGMKMVADNYPKNVKFRVEE